MSPAKAYKLDIRAQAPTEKGKVIPLFPQGELEKTLTEITNNRSVEEILRDYERKISPFKHETGPCVLGYN